jgi:hypothetical protein
MPWKRKCWGNELDRDEGMTVEMNIDRSIAISSKLTTRGVTVEDKEVRMKALRAQRLKVYSLGRHHQIGDDVIEEVSADLDLSEVSLGKVK